MNESCPLNTRGPCDRQGFHPRWNSSTVNSIDLKLCISDVLMMDHVFLHHRTTQSREANLLANLQTVDCHRRPWTFVYLTGIELMEVDHGRLGRNSQSPDEMICSEVDHNMTLPQRGEFNAYRPSMISAPVAGG
ncbi:hypothetical protein EVAR_78904_1 [Eumeta japonica]|uniref:Uncharacterized protein n=1 Tax=Eumeta variegata TaxID=151549 RepID=A0A4C1U340_EUMVA|nr:hypothetical protein EVAR_78904_1 [Eumeta japonica]